MPYKLLQPLPNMPSFDPSQASSLSTYLNIIIHLFIGICAVMAVVMIVIGGVEYMTSELVSSKEAGKKRITEAVFGLLLALGAYALLFTINPNLLNTDLNISTVTVKALPLNLIQFDATEKYKPGDRVGDSGTIPKGAVAQCPSQIVRTQSGMYACGDISQNIDSMISDAKKAGLDISGGGFRTAEQQLALRIQNCGGNTTDPNYPCSTPTATPGHSMHESGFAFDLNCNAIIISSSNNSCFQWLKTNASKYGFYNYSKEPWHWSVNGK